MKNILIPETITIKNLLTDEPMLFQNQITNQPEQLKISFFNFVVGTLLKDVAFGVNAVTVMHAIDIKDKLKVAAEGTSIEIEDEAYDLLAATLKKPAINFNTEIAMQLGSYLKSILSPDKP